MPRLTMVTAPAAAAGAALLHLFSASPITARASQTKIATISSSLTSPPKSTAQDSDFSCPMASSANTRATYSTKATAAALSLRLSFRLSALDRRRQNFVVHGLDQVITRIQIFGHGTRRRIGCTR